MKVKKRRRISLFSLLIIALLIVGIGYASINSVILEMAGTVRAEVPKNVFITNVEYVSDVDANTTNSKIKNYLGTMMQSTVELSKTNPNSEIVYKVTVYNNSTKTGTFLDVIYNSENYDNQDIVYEIQDTGFKIEDTIAPKEKKDILIKFKYKNSTLATNNVLNSYLNFKIAEPNMLKQVTSSGNYFGAVDRTKIEKISFELGTIPQNYTQSFDASANQDKSIMGYVTDTDSNNMYEITFSSDDLIFANTNSKYLFYGLTKLANISFNNLKTKTAENMSNMFQNCSSLTSLDLSKFNTSNAKYMSSIFNNCNKLTSLDLSSFNTSKVTGMSNMFQNCNSLTSLDLSKFNTTSVTDMQDMFNNCNKLTSLDLSSFNTSKVTGMSNMFQNCNSLTSLDISSFDTSNVITMQTMFYNCRSLTSLDLSKFNTTSVTDMNSMFYNCSKLTSLDLSSFDTSNVITMQTMFYNCRSLTSLNLSSFDTSYVQDMSYMFYYCDSLTSLDVSKFDTYEVTDMSHMFESCSNLVDLNVSNFITFRVTDMSYMFWDCMSLTSLNISDFNTFSVINMSSMFEFCSGLETIYASNKFNTDKVTGSEEMFNECFALIGENGTEYDSSYIDKTYARIDKEEEPGYFTNFPNIETKNYLKEGNGLDNTFLGIEDKEIITKIIFENTTSEAPTSVIDVSDAGDNRIIAWVEGTTVYIASDEEIYANRNSYDLFMDLTNCTSIENLNLLNTSDVESMGYMFYNCSSLTSLDLSSFNTNNVKTMDFIFTNCINLTDLNLSNFNVKNVSGIGGMFYNCSSLTSLDLSSFDTSNVTDMRNMFDSCDNLVTIYVSDKFTTDKVGESKSDEMFYNCLALVGGNGTKYNSSYTDKTYARIDRDGTPGYFTKRKKSVFLKKEVSSPSTFLGIGKRINITKVIIKDSTSGAPTSVTDISEDGDKSIIGWLDGTTLYIASDDNIFTNVDSSNLFSSMISLGEIEGLEKLNTRKTTNMSGMFFYTRNLANLNLSSFNTSNVKNMSHMFANCDNLSELDISKFNTEKVIDMSSMFEACMSLKKLDLSNFNTPELINAASLFSNCQSLTSLDLSYFNTTNVNIMYNMFYYCDKLKTIYASDSFNTDNVTNSNNMFESCSSLKGGNGTVYDSNHIDKAYARIDKEGTPGYFTIKPLVVIGEH